MIGAIIGDVVGSRFEFNNYKDKDFELFTDDCRVTDDSLMTLAVAKAIMETEKIVQATSNKHDSKLDFYKLLEKKTVKYLQEMGRKYPDCGYGKMFSSWIFSDDPKPYNSFGNGAAMRISPVAYIGRTEKEIRKLSEVVTSVTHNHSEGIKGAEATAVAIFMARRGFMKSEIRNKIESSYYSLQFTLDEMRDSYEFNVSCQHTVPQAILAFLESTSFEDALRNAISIGGDSDTIAAITGAIAEAYYGVSEATKEKALSYLNNEQLYLVNEWVEFFCNNGTIDKFHVLTKYIEKFSEMKSYGEWTIGKENGGTPKRPIQMPFVDYHEMVDLFVEEFYQFSNSRPEYELTDYSSILERNGLKWGSDSMKNVHVDALDEQCVLALIMGAIRADRFSTGALLNFFQNGHILKWLKRLRYA